METRSRRGPRHRNYARLNPVAESVGAQFGLTAGTVHQGIHGQPNWPERVAAVITALREGHHDALAEKVAHPILAALDAPVRGALTRECIIESQRADVEEDVCETAYLAAYEPAVRRQAAKAWRQSLLLQISTSRLLYQLLASEEGA